MGKLDEFLDEKPISKTDAFLDAPDSTTAYLGKRAGRAIANTALEATRAGAIGIGGLASAMGLDGLGDYLFEGADNVRDNGNRLLNKYLPVNDAAQSGVQRTAGNAIDMAPIIAAFVANPMLGAGLMESKVIPQAQDDINNGVDVNTAQKLLATRTALNAATMAVPAVFGKTLPTKLLSGTGIGGAQAVASPLAEKMILNDGGYTQQADEINPASMESVIPAMLLGGAFGAKAHHDVSAPAREGAANKRTQDANFARFNEQADASSQQRAEAQQAMALQEAYAHHEPVLKANGIDNIEHPELAPSLAALENQRLKISRGEEADPNNPDDLLAAKLQAEYEKSLPPDAPPTAKDSAFKNVGKDFVYSRDSIDRNDIANAKPVEIDKTGTYATDPEILARNRERETALTDEQIKLVTDKTGLTPEDVRGLTPDAQRRIFKKNAEATGDGVMRTSNANESGDMGGEYSPASTPNVPSDRTFNYGVAEDVNARKSATDQEIAGMKQTPQSRQAAMRKNQLLTELDNARLQADNLDNNQSYKVLRRKRDIGERLTDNERDVLGKLDSQSAKAKARVFDLEGQIYDVEGRSELGSKSASGNSDRPFKDTSDPNARMYEERAREQAKTAQQEALDKLEAEWKARRDARAEAEAQARAGQRRANEDAGYQQEKASESKYAGKKGQGTTTHAPFENGKFATDEFGFVKSENGNPIQFKHQRDAGWWILKRGNKGNTGQVFEIHNHPSGKGFTAKVVREDGTKTDTSRNAVAPYVKPTAEARAGKGQSSSLFDQKPPKVDNSTPHKYTDSARSLLDSIKKEGGIKSSEAKDIFGESAGNANKLSPNLFRNEGKGLDDLVQHLIETNHLTQAQVDAADANGVGGAHQLVRDLLNDAVNGKETKPLDDNSGEQAYYDSAEKEHNYRMEHDPEYRAQVEQAYIDEANSHLSAESKALREELTDAEYEDVIKSFSDESAQAEPQATASRQNDATADSSVGEDSGKPQQASPAQERPSDRTVRENVNQSGNGDRVRSEPEPAERAASDRAEPSLNVSEPIGKVGKTPNSALPVTIKDGDIYVGDEPAVNYETGENVKATGETLEDVKKALKDAGVLTSTDKVFKNAEDLSVSKKAKAESQLDALDLDPEINKNKVRAAANRLLKEGVIKESDFKEVDRILRDRDMAAEDGLDELKFAVSNFNPPKSSVGTFHSNPVEPVFVAAKDAIAHIYKNADSPAAKTARDAFKQMIDVLSSGKSSSKEKLARFARYAFISEASAMRIVANARKSAAVDKVWKALSDMGGVEGQTGKTFEDDFSERLHRNRNEVSNALSRFDGNEPAIKRIKNLLENRKAINGATPEGRAAKRIADILDREYAEQKAAGLDFGKNDNFFPRNYLVPEIAKNPAKFIAAATRAYRLDGLSPAEAKQAAENWQAYSVLKNDGAVDVPFANLGQQGKPAADFTKARTISKKAFDESGLSEFADKDVQSVLDGYLRKSAKRIEFEKRFGGTEKNADGTVKTRTAKWDAIAKQLRDEGNGDLERYVHDSIISMTGQVPSASTNGRAVVSVLRSLAVVQLLRKAVISSLGEGIQAYTRTAPLQGQIKGVANAGKVYGNALFDLTQHLKMQPLTDAIGLKNHRLNRDEQFRMAELIGSIINDHASNSAAAMRFDAISDFDAPAKGVESTANAFASAAVKASYLHDFTNSNIVDASTTIAKDFLREMTSQLGTSRLAEYELQRVGLTPEQGRSLGDYIRKDKQIDDVMADFYKGDKDAKNYIDAINRFQKQIIAQPTAADKPLLAKHPYAQLAFGLQSWLMKYWYNMQRVNIKQIGRAVMNKEGFTIGERSAMALTPLVGTYATYALTNSLIVAMRDLYSGKDKDKDFKKAQEATFLGEKISDIRTYSQSNLLGLSDPWVNRFTSARFDQDPVGSFGGAIISNQSKFLREAVAAMSDKNSDNTNTQERKLASAAYYAYIDPAVAAVTAVAPYAKVSTFLGQRDELKQFFVDSVAGEAKQE